MYLCVFIKIIFLRIPHKNIKQYNIDNNKDWFFIS